MLDDVSALGWMGHDLRDVLRFWNGLRSLLEPVRHTFSPIEGLRLLSPAGLGCLLSFPFRYGLVSSDPRHATALRACPGLWN